MGRGPHPTCVHSSVRCPALRFGIAEENVRETQEPWHGLGGMGPSFLLSSRLGLLGTSAILLWLRSRSWPCHSVKELARSQWGAGVAEARPSGHSAGQLCPMSWVGVVELTDLCLACFAFLSCWGAWQVWSQMAVMSPGVKSTASRAAMGQETIWIMVPAQGECQAHWLCPRWTQGSIHILTNAWSLGRSGGGLLQAPSYRGQRWTC